jgi:glutaminase
MLESMGRVYCEPALATELYTRQCALDVSAKDLAVMGATLAHGGFNPITREAGRQTEVCHPALAVMVTAGLYETSGDWLYEDRLARKERHRRRHRHGLARQRRARYVRAATG